VGCWKLAVVLVTLGVAVKPSLQNKDIGAGEVGERWCLRPDRTADGN
jgi:hypothetical protein